MFEIHDDIEVLKRMGMACGLEVGKCSAEDLKVARSLVPKALEPYVIGQCRVTAFSHNAHRFKDKTVTRPMVPKRCIGCMTR